jgi:hypothetical protein
LAQPPAQAQPEVNTPPVSKAKPSADDFQLPYPKDTEPVARFYGKPGIKRLSDAEVLWQKRDDRYINFLKKESFETGSYTTYMKCELTQVRVLGGPWTYSVYDGDIVKLLCRTRRFRKLISHVQNARDSANLDAVIKVLTGNVERFITEAGQVEKKLEQLAEQEPMIFRNDAPKQERLRFIRLHRGYSLSGLEIPEGAIPMSIEGAALGLTANSFLLGLTHDSRAVAPLLRIANYENIEFQKKFSAVLTDPITIVETNSLANYIVIADALDTILVSCARAEQQDLSPAAKAVAEEYVQFRMKQTWADREVVQVYPYDAPQTPYSVRASVTRKITAVEKMSIALPLHLAKQNPENLVYELGITTQIAPILRYAERFHAAAH